VEEKDGKSGEDGKSSLGLVMKEESVVEEIVVEWLKDGDGDGEGGGGWLAQQLVVRRLFQVGVDGRAGVRACFGDGPDGGYLRGGCIV